MAEKTTKPKKRYTLDQMVMRTINGIYGFGSKRKQLIEAEGWNYKKIQDAIKKKRDAN